MPYPEFIIFKASFFVAWFKLHIVIAGNGIDAKLTAEGFALIITGLLLYL